MIFPKVAHDALACGIDLESSCAGCRKMSDDNRLQLRQPGPQAHNQIAGTFEEQIARALNGQPNPLPVEDAGRLAATIREYPGVLTPALIEVLAEPVTKAIAAAIDAAMRERRRIPA